MPKLGALCTRQGCCGGFGGYIGFLTDMGGCTQTESWCALLGETIIKSNGPSKIQEPVQHGLCLSATVMLGSVRKEDRAPKWSNLGNCRSLLKGVPM